MTTDTQDQRTFSTDDELDLSGEGLQATTVVCLITKAELAEPKADGSQRWEITLEPEEAVDGLAGNKAKDSGYWLHPASAGNEDKDLQKIGRGVLKRIFRAILGTDKGSLRALEGQRVQVEIKESDDGYTRVGKYKAAK